MTKNKTRDAALSRLFGAEGEGAGAARGGADDALDLDPDATSESAIAIPSEPRESKARVRPSPKKRNQNLRRTAPANEENALDPERGEERAASGYIGLGKYAREDRILERITPYVRPDQAEALRVAVARKRDPRGRDISQIIQRLLDEAGYRGQEE